MSFKNTDRECVMQLKSDNIEIMINDKTIEFIKNFLKYFLSGYQIGLTGA